MSRMPNFSASRVAAFTPDVSGTRTRDILRFLDNRGFLTAHARRELLNPPCPLDVPLADLLDPPLKANGRIARPQNPFIIYRRNAMAALRSTVSVTGRKVIHELSRRTAEMWAQEPLAVVDYFKLLAEVHKEIHRIRYPTYKYHPTKTARAAESGKPNCAKRPSLDGKACLIRPSDIYGMNDMNNLSMYGFFEMWSPMPPTASEGTPFGDVDVNGSATVDNVFKPTAIVGTHVPNHIESDLFTAVGGGTSRLMPNTNAHIGFYWAPLFSPETSTYDPATTPIIDPPTAITDLNATLTTSEGDSSFMQVGSFGNSSFLHVGPISNDLSLLALHCINSHVM